MKIGGLQKMTMLDFPGRVACTVFTYGCNLRCPFCHNASLVIDEAELLDGAEDTDLVYVEKILPEKMYYNLRAIEEFSFFGDIKIMFMTVFAVLGKEYKDEKSVKENPNNK